jgi:hypothetical protein
MKKCDVYVTKLLEICRIICKQVNGVCAHLEIIYFVLTSNPIYR